MLLFAAAVMIAHLPQGGIQPQVAQDAQGTAHVIYLSGDPTKADIWYTHTRDGKTFAPPVQVNHAPAAAIARGSMRGPHLAVGRNGRVHVVWMGSMSMGSPTPFLYTSLDPKTQTFAKERNLIESAYGLDGGGTVAADDRGHVFVLWHAPAAGKEGEANRQVWLRTSTDDGATFAKERTVWNEPTGACGCCGMRAYVEPGGRLRVIYRSAFEVKHRDMYLLESRDLGKTFTGAKVDEWEVPACVMSTTVLGDGFAAWETRGQIKLKVDGHDGLISPAGEGKRRHPVVARNRQGQVLLAWDEGTSFAKGGSVAWQVFGKDGMPVGDAGSAPGLPVMDIPAAFSTVAGEFVLIY